MVWQLIAGKKAECCCLRLPQNHRVGGDGRLLSARRRREGSVAGGCAKLRSSPTISGSVKPPPLTRTSWWSKGDSNCEPLYDALVNSRYLKAEATRPAMDRNGSDELRARRPKIARSIMGRSSARWRRNPASLSMPTSDTTFICPGSIAVSAGRSGGLAPGVANRPVKAVILPCGQPKSPRPFEHPRPRSSSEICNSPLRGLGLRNRIDRHAGRRGKRRAQLRNQQATGRAQEKRLGPTRISPRRPPCGFSCRHPVSPRQCQ